MERFISPEGTFPVFGRSIPYRMATMQPLALMAWYQELPAGVTNAQVRCALTAVMKRMFASGHNFNEGGFLTIGFTGRQPNVADWYTNNGSLYMTSLSHWDFRLLILSGPMRHRNGPACVLGEKSLSRKITTGEMKSVHGICSKKLLSFVNKG